MKKLANRRLLFAPSGGFTVIELLTGAVITIVLGGLLFSALAKMRKQAEGVICINSLRQFGSAARMYLDDHNQVFFRYKKKINDINGPGVLWYFGFEPSYSTYLAEGERTLDVRSGPLSPYIEMAGEIETCPAFSYKDVLVKPKFKGASFGYGFNNLLDGVHFLKLEVPSRVIIFGDCAQVNNFQLPASPSNPMLEEFYIINDKEVTVHFRHAGGRAQFVFADGHVESLPMSPGTLDRRLRSVNVGRITPVGSKEYLQ